MNLVHALRLSGAPRLALVGAGGKTTALFQIARQLTPPVIVTATTHLMRELASQADRWIETNTPTDIPVAGAISPEVLLVTGLTEADGRTLGVGPAVLQRLLELSNTLTCPLLIEADGSRQLPLKAPAEHEPAIPQFCDTVLVLAGLSALGKPMQAESVHRWARFSELSGLAPGEMITPQAVARVLLHPLGGQKHISPGVRRVALLNQADSVELQAQGATIARLLLPGYDAVLIAALASPIESGHEGRVEGTVYAVLERVAGVILAAGAAHRYGSPKVLLSWKGAPFIQHVANTAISAGLDPVVVVAGEHYPAICEALRGLPVTVLHNPEWESGQSSSIRTGINALARQYWRGCFPFGGPTANSTRFAASAG